MSCHRWQREVAQRGRLAGIGVVAGQGAYYSGITAARAIRAGIRAQQLVDRKLLDSPIPTQLGVLAMAGGVTVSVSISLLRAMIFLERQQRQHCSLAPD
ncbi:MAG: hypothetical protein Kow0031_02600 [Anaerolineae bacterium]